jgi:putative NIF3 family GTP cyclohydrolase 1 type 2
MQQTIQDVIDTIVEEIPGAPREDSVDTAKSGDPSQAVTGIVTTFIATCQVIERAIELGANLIITHEPTYYNHRDEVAWLKGDPVYAHKRDMLEGNGIVVWRFHDYWHMHRPDGITTGVLKQLGWESYVDPDQRGLCTVPATSLSELVALIRERLGIDLVRVTGDPSMTCRGVALIVGAVPGEMQVEILGQEGVDVLVCGESQEWTACEYVRDAACSGVHKALIVLGHANSEEPGMKWLVEWLHPRFPGLAITHIPAGDPFRYM